MGENLNPVNELAPPILDESIAIGILRTLAANTYWMPVKFLTHVRQCNEEQQKDLIRAHPQGATHTEDLKQFFLPQLAVAYPFTRRLIASERKAGSWLFRYHVPSGRILDDNRIPKGLWSHVWCGRHHKNNSSVWEKHGFKKYEASHIVPHKKSNHEGFFMDLFEEGIKIDPSLLFLATWNNLLVSRVVAGLTDNSPLVAAVLLKEVERRYQIDLGILGKRRRVIEKINVDDISKDITWKNEPNDFKELWSSFKSYRFKWTEKILTDESRYLKAPVPAEA